MPLEVSDKDVKAITEALGMGWKKTSADLGIVLRAAGYPVSDEDASLLAKEISLQDNEYLTVNQVCLAAAKIPAEMQAQELLGSAFEEMNKHKDGTITVEDLRLVFENMADIKMDEVEMLIEELDPDDVGRVYLDVVYNTLNSKNLCGYNT